MQVARDDIRCKVLSVAMSAVLGFGLVPTVALADEDDATAEENFAVEVEVVAEEAATEEVEEAAAVEESADDEEALVDEAAGEAEEEAAEEETADEAEAEVEAEELAEEAAAEEELAAEEETEAAAEAEDPNVALTLATAETASSSLATLADDSVTVDGVAYTLCDVEFDGTGDYSGSTWDVLGTMVYKYFGYSVYVSDQLDDDSYNVVVYFGGDSGYSDAIENFTVYTDSTNSTESGTVSQSEVSEISDDPVYVFNVDDPSETIYCYLYIGGSMGMGVTFSIDVDWTDTSEDEEEEESEDESADDSAESDDESADDSADDSTESEDESTDDESTDDESTDDESTDEEADDSADADDESTSDSDSDSTESDEEATEDESDSDSDSDDESDDSSSSSGSSSSGSSSSSSSSSSGSSSSGSSSSSTSSNSTDDYGLEVGATYSMDVTYSGTGAYASLQSTLDNMVGGYFGYSVYVTPLSDGSYDVVVYFGGTKGYSSAVEDMTYEGETISQSDDTTYTINVDSLDEEIDLSLYVGGSMDMTVTFAINLDVDSATLISSASSDDDESSDDDTTVAVDKSSLESLLETADALTQGSKTDDAWETLQEAIADAQAVYDDGDATQAEVSKAVAALNSAIETFNNSSEATTSSSSSTTTTGWQVGHTYEVPMTFLKDGSSETSMAAQYFGDTALVYVLSDGSLQVTFAATDEGLEEVTAISYNGTAVTQDGNQFTFVIPASYSDTAIPLEMTINTMTLLGVGAQTADLYLYLSQAEDLGTGLEDMEASSTSSLADTGDSTDSAVVAVAFAGAAAAGLAVYARRRSSAAAADAGLKD